MPFADYKKPIFLVFFLALALRVFHLNLPFLEPYNSQTRQAVSGMVARNFYQHGFNFLYPELDDNGAGPYLFNAEMPFYAYLMALGYKLAGGPQEWAARSVSVAFSMGALLVLYWLVRRAAGERPAWIAALFFALSPMNLALNRSVQPDALMIFASLAALYAFTLYRESGRASHLFWSAAFMFLAVGTKAYVLYLFLPLIWLAWEKEGTDFFKNRRYYLYIAGVGSALIWYGYMWSLGRGQALAYSTISYSHDRGAAYSHIWQIFSFRYLYATFKIFCIHILTPVGTPLFLLGLFSKPRFKGEKFFYAWFYSVVLFMLIFWRTAIDHAYYQLPFVPVCAYFVAKGFEALADSKYKKLLKNVLVTGPAVLLTLGCLAYFYRGLYFIPERGRVIVEAGRAAEQLTKESLIVVASDASPVSLLYYSNRKGWKFNLLQTDETAMIRQLEEWRAQGAAYFVTTEPALFKNRPIFEEYLRSRFSVVRETPKYLIFGL